MDMSTQEPDFSLPKTTNQRADFLLLKGYAPGNILEPRYDAPKGSIWCKHCSTWLVIGAESVSHQNLVRASQVCMDCGAWNYLDEDADVEHLAMCASKVGQRVKLSIGGSQARATAVPPHSASQEEAASFPYEPTDNLRSEC